MCALALHHQLVPPTINYRNPDPECDLDYVPNEAREVELDVALSNAMGLGGHNGCVLLGRVSAPPPRQAPPPWCSLPPPPAPLARRAPSTRRPRASRAPGSRGSRSGAPGRRASGRSVGPRRRRSGTSSPTFSRGEGRVVAVDRPADVGDVLRDDLSGLRREDRADPLPLACVAGRRARSSTRP